VNAVEQFDLGKGKIHKTSDQNLIETVNVNTLPMVFMMRFLGPKLKSRINSDKRSAIINITSYYTKWLTFNTPIYCASKSFSDGIS
jgi:short-subunit dehydrogenase